MKFNTALKNRTFNHEGATAFSMQPQEKLVSRVLTSFFNETKFYGDNSSELVANLREVLATEPKFVANLAIYARREMHLRTIAHVLCAELAHDAVGKEYLRATLMQLVERPDDLTEILAYYLQTFGKPIPNALKKGLADALRKFDAYQLAKYNRAHAVKLRDLLCLVHPKAETESQSELWKKLLENRLEPPITWETELSKYGNRKEVWERLIAEKKLGYMAMLRNLRNIIKAEITNLPQVYQFLSDATRVLQNKQLPFRYYNAYRILQQEGLGTSKIFDALEAAIKISTKNIPRLPGKTLIAADVSGSMNSPISAKSQITCAEIAVLLLAIANYICEETITTTFDNHLYLCQLATHNGIIANANGIKVNGGGTDITLPLHYLLQKKIKVDRIIILSDNEINRGYNYRTGYGAPKNCQALFTEYQSRINPQVWLHAIDLQGYGTQQFAGRNVNLLAGWNERIFDFISASEAKPGSLLEKINHYYF